VFLKPQHFHFVGIDGIGMSGLAEIVLTMGHTVSGSDLKRSANSERLAGLGATIHQGHDAAYVAGAKAVVVTSAVNESNPEVAEARRLLIPVIPRGELLAELMRLRYGIAIGGSHGKTTTTSMTAEILSHAGLDPTIVVGGRVRTMGGSNARLGKSEFLVVESDESDGSFLRLTPILAAVTNIDREHLDHYGSFDRVLDAFVDFINKVPFYGAAVLCLDDEQIQGILPRLKRRVVTYGFSAQADLRITDLHAGHFQTRFRLMERGDDLGEFHLNVPGVHNALNATAAAALALELDLAPEKIQEGLARFSGVDRRFQTRGVEAGVTVIDDYAHHPTEIRATLAAAAQCQYGHLHVVFQPHRYTRTHDLMDEFARSFHQASTVLVLDIYAASEVPIDGVTSEVLVERMRAHGHRAAGNAGSFQDAATRVASVAQPGDAVLLLGAGSISQASDAVLAALKERSRG
jgi:UDP-N-acetylmuramate--alanine ligase